MENLLKKFMGWVLIILGLLIVFTPFTPGSILLLIGLNMVFGHWPEWQAFKEKIIKLLNLDSWIKS